jgi:hypothetical protein
MRLIIIAVAAGLVAAPSLADSAGSHRTRGYVTRRGTYVAPHHATNPNHTRVDNWSSRPNINPYTGKRGYRDPYRMR